MTASYLGEILIFGGSYAIHRFAFCNGGILPITSNQALFSLLGTAFGGDGRSDFALPDLRGRLPIGQGSGPGLSNRFIGNRVGLERVTLAANQLPTHTHAVIASDDEADSRFPVANLLATRTLNEPGSYAEDDPSKPTVDFPAAAVRSTGDNAEMLNVMPVLAISFIISMHGVYPSRN